jgi:hypothetical protein
MEKIIDLLDPYKTKVNLQIREDPTKVGLALPYSSQGSMLRNLPAGNLRRWCNGGVRHKR